MFSIYRDLVMLLSSGFLQGTHKAPRHGGALGRERSRIAGLRKAVSIYRDEIVLNMAALCFFLTIHSVVPYLSQYAVEIGATEAAIALLGPFFAFSAMAVRPLSGILADRGLTKALLAIGAAVSAAAQAIYFVAPIMQFLYLGRFIQGIAVAMFIPASFQAAAIGNREAVISSLAWRNTVVGLSFAVGPALGGYVAQHLGYRALFVLSMVLASLACLLSLLVNSARFSRAAVGGGSSEDGPWILNPGYIAALASLLIYSSVYASMVLFLPAYHKEAGLGASSIAIFFTGMATSNFLSRLIFTGIIRTIGVGGTAVLGIALLSVGYIMVSIDPLSDSIVYYGIVAGLGSGMAMPSLQVIAITGIPQRRRGIASAIYTAMFDLGNLTGPVSVSAIAGTYRDMISLSGFLSLAALVPVALLQTPWLRKSPRDQG